jgi:hypothetical protein
MFGTKSPPNISERPTSDLSDKFRRARPFLYFPLGLLGECAPFATLAADMGGRRRRVSPVMQADTCCNTRKKSAFL